MRSGASRDQGDRPAREDDLRDLEETLGYSFDDQRLLLRAVTHRSYVNEHAHAHKDNQRLEFLGDAVLGVAIAEILFRLDEKAPEGALSSQLSRLVCAPALREIAETLELGRYLRLGRGEELSGGREKEGVLSDAYEAVLGAIFLDGGHEAALDVIQRIHEEAVEAAVSSAELPRGERKSPTDFKSYLQRWVQSEGPGRPEYRIVETTGPPHARRFVAEVVVEGRVLGSGEGTSKKAAEQAAAEVAIAAMTPRAGKDSLASDGETE